jgi:putative acetyltransferase
MSEKAPDLNSQKDRIKRIPEIAVRLEAAADQLAVFRVNAAAFGREKEARLVDALRLSDASVPELSLVAEKNGVIVGYILFTKVEFTSNPDHRGLAIGPVSVAPDVQKLGIGGELIKTGIEKARKLGFDSVMLLGHPEYYPRFGFVPASNWNITTSYGAPNATFALELKQGALDHTAGEARYAKEFALNGC